MRLARAKADKGDKEEAKSIKSRPDETKDNKATLCKKRNDEVMRNHLFKDSRIGIKGS